MKLPWYMKEIQTDNEMKIQFHWMWVWWQRIIFKFINKRDIIFSGNANIGTILKVYPKHRSHVARPYFVKIVQTDNEGFTTELIHPEEHTDPHIHRFEYNSASWVDYHCDRFRIMRGEDF